MLTRTCRKDIWEHESTEFFSTRFGFNKAINKRLYFFSGKKITEMAGKHNMELEIIDNTKLYFKPALCDEA